MAKGWITKKDENGNVKHIPIEEKSGTKINEPEHKEDLELRDLDNYIGSEKLYRVMGANVTDGVIYVMNNGYSWFVTDAISLIKTKLKNEEFLTAELHLNKENNTADMVITDGDNHILYRQRYKWTDAKRDLKLYYTDGVLMLNNEY